MSVPALFQEVAPGGLRLHPDTSTNRTAAAGVVQLFQHHVTARHHGRTVIVTEPSKHGPMPMSPDTRMYIHVPDEHQPLHWLASLINWEPQPHSQTINEFVGHMAEGRRRVPTMTVVVRPRYKTSAAKPSQKPAAVLQKS